MNRTIGAIEAETSITETLRDTYCVVTTFRYKEQSQVVNFMSDGTPVALLLYWCEKYVVLSIRKLISE
jgi:hypothetical protein